MCKTNFGGKKNLGWTLALNFLLTQHHQTDLKKNSKVTKGM
jgi:hypothetical protein